MAFADQYDLARPGATADAFEKRVFEAMMTAAHQIVGEDQGSMTGTNHKKRHDLAHAILNAPDEHIQNFKDSVVTNASITAASTDADVQFTVNSNFGDIAGVGQLS
jgi:hypothetical protein